MENIAIGFVGGFILAGMVFYWMGYQRGFNAAVEYRKEMEEIAKAQSEGRPPPRFH